MSDSKKDLTRIEDLGEYLHELNSEEETSFFESNDNPPELPAEEFDFSSTNFETDTFSSEEIPSSPEAEAEAEAGPEETDSFFSETEISFDGNGENQTFPEANFTSNENLSDDTSEFNIAPELETSQEPIATEDINATPSFDQVYFETKEETHIDQKKEIPTSYTEPETYEDLKKFAENTTTDGMGAEGNPSFSVLLRDVKYIEDVQDIILLLKELQLLNDSEEVVKQRLTRGHLLIPRISEFAAIFLAHKLRRFDIDIQVGFSDEIHPPKHKESPETGLVSKNTLFQNHSHQFHFENTKLDLSQIILSTSSNLDGHQVLKYIGIATEHKMLESVIVEEEASEEIPMHYSDLANKLKAHALKANANAVIGLNYQLTPIPTEYGAGVSKYRLSCTGNLVWINKL